MTARASGTLQGAPRVSLPRNVFGPTRTGGETIVVAVGSAVVMVLLADYILHAGVWLRWSVPQKIVIAAVIFDLVFGMLTISTTTAKRWYHRPGPAVRRFRFAFVIVHLVPYIVLVAALFDIGFGWALANAGLLLAGTALIDFTPTDLKRLVAICLTLTAGLVNLIWLPLPSALAWLPLLLFVKIMMCFLLPEPRR